MQRALTCNNVKTVSSEQLETDPNFREFSFLKTVYNHNKEDGYGISNICSIMFFFLKSMF